MVVSVKTLLVSLVVASGLSLSACNMCSKPAETPTDKALDPSLSATTPAVDPASKTALEELKVEVLKEGQNETAAVSGKKVTVHYTGRLTDGKVFDSSEQRQAPFAFILGAGQVIPGWEKGVTGMKIGERRKLTIPYHLAYGDKGVGSVIPPKATLVFEVELLNVE